MSNFLAIATVTATLQRALQSVIGTDVPGAKVTVKSVATGVETSVDANDQGLYSIALLPPGQYTIAVSKPGFQTLRQTSLELVVQQVARLDLTLQVGQITETVDVYNLASYSRLSFENRGPDQFSEIVCGFAKSLWRNAA